MRVVPRGSLRGDALHASGDMAPPPTSRFPGSEQLSPEPPEDGGVTISRPAAQSSLRAAARSQPVALVGCLVLAAWLVLPGLGDRPLYSAGEVRCGLIARAMVENGDWIVPRLNGVRYFEKPPLLYWGIGLAYRAFGVTEYAARLPAALAYIATVAAVFLIGLELLGPLGGPYAALIFATAPAAFHFGRFVSLDTVMTFFFAVSLLGLIVATRSHRDHAAPSNAAGAWTFWLGMALAGLTKGFIGLLLPLATATLYARFVGGRGTLRLLRPKLGALIIASVFLPWHVVMAWREPSFVHFYVFNEHIYRFLNLREPIDYAPLSIPAFWLAVCLWFFPSSMLWPGALAWALRRPRGLAIPLLWVGVVIGFFTLMQARLEYYGQPAYPALAIVVAGYWLSFTDTPRRALGLTVPAWIMVVLGGGAIVVASLWPDAVSSITTLVSNLDGYYREYFLKHPDKGFFFARQALQLGKPFGLAWLLLGAGALWAVRARRFDLALLIWVTCLVPTARGFDRGIELLVDDRSQRAAAEIVQAHWEHDAALIVAGTYEDAGGVTFYTGLPTYMTRGQDGDLLFGERRGDAPDLFLTAERLRELWRSPRRVFLLTGVDRPPLDGTALLETPRHRLLTNRPLTSVMRHE